MKRRYIFSVLSIIAVLLANSIHAQEPPVDYKQLVTKCSEALKHAKSYNVKMEVKYSFTINSRESKSNSAELHVAYISPDKFKVAQVMGEGLWDGWIVIGNDYYVLNAVYGWAKEDDDNRRMTCKACSPEGIIRQLEGTEKKYKRDSIKTVTNDGIEYYVIRYLVGKEAVDVESLPPELRDSKIIGICEIWINKNNYLPLKQSEEISYYSNEQTKGASSTSINYMSYNDNNIKIDRPVIGGKTF